MIRLLHPDEVKLCVEGGKSFFNEGKMPGGFVPSAFIHSWSKLIESGVGAIHASFDGDTITGGIAAILCPNMFNGKTMAVECLWYVLPEYRGQGLKLFFAFEEWAKRHGATMLSMIHLHALQPEKLKKLYERMGYHAVETNYIKEVA